MKSSLRIQSPAASAPLKQTRSAGVPPAPLHFERSAKGSRLQCFCRKALFKRLSSVRAGCIEIVEGAQRVRFGDACAGAWPVPVLKVHDPSLYTRAVFGGMVGAAESYMDGEWSCDDLTALIRVFIQNFEALDKMERGLARLPAPLLRLAHWLRSNTLRGSRRNIAAHYDLSNDFFALFLDDTMTYSSAYFERLDLPLAEASAAKNERLCRMLRLNRNDHLLEIGCGWGGFAIHAAGRYGCRVTAATISQEQYNFAKERIANAGLKDRITLLLEDYRRVCGQYDKIASIEMIEAVGHNFLDGYFQRCSQLLKPHGAMALQAITIPDRRFAKHARTVDFIKKHIFPGSCLPSVARMLEATRTFTNLSLVRLDEITPHYARTLRIWRQRFFEKLDAVRAMGFGEKFIRMWEFYLCYCEAGFAEQYIGTVQMLFAKPAWREPGFV